MTGFLGFYGQPGALEAEKSAVARYGIGVATALPATLILYLGMTMLLNQTLPPQEPTIKIRPVFFQSIIDPPKTKPRPAPPEPPVTTKEPEVPPIETTEIIERPLPPTRNTKPKEYGPWIDPTPEINTDGWSADTAPMPIVRVEPTYPVRALTSEIEGHVVLRFTILANGMVDAGSIEVVSSDPVNVFERAAIAAVKKWRYRAAVENGAPVSRHGVETRLSFALSNSDR